MSATGGVESPAVEQPLQEEVAVAEDQSQQPEEKEKEKTKKAPKEKKPRAPKTASHPPYFQMIKEALLALDEKSGSSPYAIAKYMEEKHKAVLPANFRKILGLQLKNSAAKGKLIKIRASYKLSEAGEKDKGATMTKAARANAEKKPKQAKPAAAVAPKAKEKMNKPETEKKATRPARKAAAAPKKAKRSASVKPKQPRSIKSPAAKKAKKAVA